MSDPGHPEECNVCHYWQVFAPDQASRIWEECRTSKRGCTQNKQELAEQILQVTEPFRAQRGKVAEERAEKILAEGAQKARVVARETMREVKQAVGLA